LNSSTNRCAYGKEDSTEKATPWQETEAGKKDAAARHVEDTQEKAAEPVQQELETHEDKVGLVISWY
jgi:hypothetical protein